MKVLLRSGFLLALWAGGARPVAAHVAPPDTSQVRQSHRRVVFQFDQRYSLLNGSIVGINGLKAGIEWRGRLRTGLGVYLLSDGVPTDVALPAHLPAGTRDELRFRYVAAYGEYVVVGTPRWELSTPTQLGIGRYYARYEKPDGAVERTPKQLIYILEPSVAGHVRIFRWIGLGAGGGYRQMLFQANALESELNGPIFFGRVKLFLGDLYKIVRGRQRLFSQQGL